MRASADICTTSSAAAGERGGLCLRVMRGIVPVIFVCVAGVNYAEALPIPEKAGMAKPSQQRFIPDGKRLPSPTGESVGLVASGSKDSVIRPNVAVACGTTATRSQVVRRRAAAKMGSNLSSAEIRIILDFLDEKLADQTEYRSLVYNAIKNDVSWKLLHQTKPVESYCNALVKMYRDPQHDYVWRDYCIQHMMIYCTELKKTSKSGTNAAITYSVFACLQDAAKKIQTPLAGTALVGMASIAGESGTYKDINVAEIATSIAANTQACNEARATAIQIAAEQGDLKILPLARKLISTHKDVTLRVSAIAAIGKIGSNSDVEMLKNLSNHRDSRINTAARHALKKLKAQHEEAKK